MKPIDLYTPSGIGDIYWILMKLARAARSQGRKFRIHTPPGADIKMSRGKFLEFIDVVESVTPDGIPYTELIDKAKARYPYEQLNDVMLCECNTWLEEGQRIEHYLPAFDTEFVLNWQVNHESLRRAKRFLNPQKKNIVVYTSGKQNNASTSTGKWQASDWKPRIERLAAMPDVNLIWIGASYDTDLIREVGPLSGAFSNVLIDEPADVVVMLLRMCDGFISYQSGLSVISVVEGIPTFMLYFRKIENLRYGFNPPDANYEAQFFDDLPDFTEWVKKLPMREVLGRGVAVRDYTFWVDQNIEQTEKDWLENPKGHSEQFDTIKDLRGSILEVGCGAGHLAKHVTESYTGLDQSEKLLSLCRARCPEKVFAFANIREVTPEMFSADHVCAFGFMKHFSLTEWDSIFAKLAGMARKTLTIEAPISEPEWAEVGYDFPHVFVSKSRIQRLAKEHGFTVTRESLNSADEWTFRLERI